MRLAARLALGAALAITAAIALAEAPATPAVSAGTDHALALGADGKVRGWGSDSLGQLGSGRLLSSSTPQAVTGAGGVVALASGLNYSLALTSSGTVLAWGDNRSGQLGDGTTLNLSTPVRVVGLTGVVAIAAGNVTSVAVRNDGSVRVWGAGPLGNGAIGGSLVPVPVAGLTGVTSADVGLAHVVVRRSDGSVWAWGYNGDGQLGNGSTDYGATPAPVPGLAGITAVAAGGRYSLALMSDQTVVSWGQNDAGQLGDGTTDSRSTPGPVASLSGVIAIAAKGNQSLALKQDGTVWTWGQGYATPVQVTGLAGVTAIAAGPFHALARLGDGSVRAWGLNFFGQLGDGTNDYAPISAPVQVTGLSGAVALSAGDYHSVAAVTGGGAMAWGDNNAGELGDGSIVSRTSPILASGFEDMVAVAAGADHTVALKSDGTVWAAGYNVFGQLGDLGTQSRSVAVQASGVSGASAVAAGGFFTLALATGGTVWSWGYNADGELGNGTLANNATPAPIASLSGVTAIAAGQAFALALESGGTVLGWGYNGYGQIGAGGSASSPRSVAGLDSVVALAAGSDHALFLRGNGTVWALGSSAYGQLGNGTTGVSSSAPVQVAGLTDVIAIDAGGGHSVALCADGTVWAWGRNAHGELGDGTTIDRATPVQVAGLAGVVAISAGGRGANYIGGVVGVTVALKADGSVWAWGGARSGQVGDGTYVSRSRPVVVVAEGAAGSLDGNDWFLDLTPAVPAVIPAASVPRSLVSSRFDGAGTLRATVKYRQDEIGTAQRTFVLGLVPPAFFGLVPTAPGTASAKALEQRAARSGHNLVLAQLTPQGWTDVTGQLIAYSSGVASSLGGATSILTGVPLASIPGARFCVGYGESADAMLSAQSLREVLLLEGAVGSASGLPCVLSGVYVDGPPASVLGSPVTFTATVVGLSPTGAVQFKDGFVDLGSAVSIVLANEAVATAAVTTSALAAGVHSIVAQYGGDGQNAAAGSGIPRVHEVRAPLAQTRVDLAGPVGSQVGEEVAFVATITGSAPTGTVQFRDGGANLGAAVPVTGGVATLRIDSLAQGDHAIDAVYAGDGANAGGGSGVVAHRVVAAATAEASLAVSANPVTTGQPVNFTVTVAGSAPTGTVTLREGARIVDSASLTSGQASFAIASLEAGVRVFSADYSGDGGNPPVTSNAVFLLVNLDLPPAGDYDGDGIPNGVELAEGRDPLVKDNDVFSPTLASARLFAMQQYRDFVNREADPFGLSFWSNAVVHGHLDTAGGDRRLPQLAGVRGVRGAGGAALLRHLPARARLRGPHLQCGAGAERDGDAHAAGGLLHGEPGVRLALRGAGQHAVRHAPLRERAGARAGSGRALRVGGVAQRRLHARAGAAGLLGFRRVPGGDGERGVRDDDVLGDASTHGGALGLHRMAELPRRGHFHARAGDQRVLPFHRVSRDSFRDAPSPPAPLPRERGAKRSLLLREKGWG